MTQLSRVGVRPVIEPLTFLQDLLEAQGQRAQAKAVTQVLEIVKQAQP